MTRRSLLILSIMLAALASVVAARPAQDAQPGHAEPANAQPAAIRFIALDVFVDAGDTPLASWQIEYEGAADNGAVQLVGVEGAQHPAFTPAPHYDPAALATGRVIIAAYSTADDLPTGETRVARLHLSVPADAEVTHTVKLIAAGDHDAHRVPATARVQTLQTETPKP